MPYNFLDLLSTPSVRAAQQRNGSAQLWSRHSGSGSPDRFGEMETAFIAQRDSFYMATVSETGWPYVQHRGGPPGFLRVIDDRTLGFADFAGNRQYISLGNLANDDRVSLFLMDYPNRRRLKILAHAEVRDLANDLDLAEQLALPSYRARVERAMLFHIESFDWNCPQHITPRFTEAELVRALAPMRERLAALEAENQQLKRAASIAAKA